MRACVLLSSLQTRIKPLLQSELLLACFAPHMVPNVRARVFLSFLVAGGCGRGVRPLSGRLQQALLRLCGRHGGQGWVGTCALCSFSLLWAARSCRRHSFDLVSGMAGKGGLPLRFVFPFHCSRLLAAATGTPSIWYEAWRTREGCRFSLGYFWRSPNAITSSYIACTSKVLHAAPQIGAPADSRGWLDCWLMFFIGQQPHAPGAAGSCRLEMLCLLRAPRFLLPRPPCRRPGGGRPSHE
jgi:hypothetical protein